MSLFKFSWLRKIIRKHTSPIAEDRAYFWKERLSLVYAIVAWNAFGFVCYMIYNGKSDWAKYHGLKSEEQLNMSPGHQWAKTLGLEQAKVFRLEGTSFKEVEK